MSLFSDVVSEKNRLILEITDKKLYMDEEWLLLMRYKRGLRGWLSEADNPEYFFSKNGKYDPRKELEANLLAFFDESEYPDENVKMHPQCAFPARFDFIKKKLNPDPSILKHRPCEKLRVWKEALNPDSVSVVFASYYLGSPASIMGHLLFKINSKQNKNKELLDYGINYAAINTEGNPLSFIWNGMTGGYDGIFSIYPYYLKVNEYNDMETRDLWEYELALNERELERFLNHLWELLWQTKFDYFFFDENCAYHMYGLIEYSRFGLKLRDKFNPVVNPPDALKKYLSIEGLVKSRKFRPSLYTQIEQKINLMTDIEKEIFYELWESKNEVQITKTGVRKDLILDTILDSYRWKEQKDEKNIEDKKNYKKYLLRRAEIEEDSYKISENDYRAVPPESIHKFSNFSLYQGYSTFGSYQDFRYRLGYHDLLNSENGFSPNSEVFLGDISLRYYNQKNSWEIDRFIIGRLNSFTPHNRVSNPTSYKIELAFDSVMKKNEYTTLNRDVSILSGMNLNDPINQSSVLAYYNNIRNREDAYKIHPFNIESLFGKTYSLLPDSKLYFSMLVGPKFQFHSDFIGGFRFAPAGFINLTYEVKNWKFRYTAGYFYYTLSQNSNDYHSGLSIRYSITENRELRFEWNSQAYFSEGNLGLMILF